MATNELSEAYASESVIDTLARFSYSFGRYRIGIRRDAKRAGSVSFGIGMFTYMKKGKYEPLRRGAIFAALSRSTRLNSVKGVERYGLV